MVIHVNIITYAYRSFISCFHLNVLRTADIPYVLVVVRILKPPYSAAYIFRAIRTTRTSSMPKIGYSLIGKLGGKGGDMHAGGFIGPVEHSLNNGTIQIDLNGDGKKEEVELKAVVHHCFAVSGIFADGNSKLNQGDKYVGIDDVNELSVGKKTYKVGESLGGRRISGFAIHGGTDFRDGRLPESDEGELCQPMKIYLSAMVEPMFEGDKDHIVIGGREVDMCVKNEEGVYTMMSPKPTED